MKPWERDWGAQPEAQKPWERDWSAQGPSPEQPAIKPIPPDSTLDLFRGLGRGAAASADVVTAPLRAISQATVGRAPASLASHFDEPFTPEGRIAEKVSEYGTLGGGIGAVSRRFGAAAKPFIDAGLAALSGAGGQTVREYASDDLPPAIKEGLAFGAEVATPAGLQVAAKAGARLVAESEYVRKGLNLLGKAPVVGTALQTKRMLSKKGQQEAANDWFRTFVEKERDLGEQAQKAAQPILGTELAAGAARKSERLLGVEQAYLNAPKFEKQAARLKTRMNELNQSYERAATGAGRTTDGYFEHTLRARMADELPDRSVSSIRAWAERNAADIGRLSPDTPLAQALARLEQGGRGSNSLLNLVFSRPQAMYKRAQKLLGGNPQVQVNKLYSDRQNPIDVAQALVSKVKNPDDYEAVVGMVAEDLGTKVQMWAKNVTSKGDPDALNVAKSISDKMSREGMSRAYEAIFRDKSAREALAIMRDHMKRHSIDPSVEPIPDVPSVLVNMASKIAGARFGAAVNSSSGGGGTIQIPGIFSKFFGDLTNNATGGHFHRRVVDLLLDKEIRDAAMSGGLDAEAYARYGREALRMGPAVVGPAVINQAEQLDYGRN